MLIRANLIPPMTCDQLGMGERSAAAPPSSQCGSHHDGHDGSNCAGVTRGKTWSHVDRASGRRDHSDDVRSQLGRARTGTMPLATVAGKAGAVLGKEADSQTARCGCAAVPRPLIEFQAGCLLLHGLGRDPRVAVRPGELIATTYDGAGARGRLFCPLDGSNLVTWESCSTLRTLLPAE